MSFKTLLEPITEKGIRNTNFFEGRLLSGKDLSEQETANKQHRQQLGKILGHGVVEGLEVSVENVGTGTADPVVRVSKGMAITLDGEVLELPIDYVDIQLSRTLDSVDASIAVFKNCTDLPSETLVPSGAGLYILVMSPVSTYQDYAPKSGLQKQGVAQNCGRAYSIEGVQFRLVKFDPTMMPNISEQTRSQLSDEYLSASNPVDSSDLKRLSMMRNLVAHVCFGTDGIATSAKEPTFINKATTTVGLDALLGMDEGLTSCDTTLALIYWNVEGIQFIDNWAVKRKASHRDVVGYSVPSFTRQSYSRADESRMQFQEQLDYLQDEIGNLSEVQVKEYFRYLPPIGYLPIRVGSVSHGFDEINFFHGLTIRSPVFVEASCLAPIAQLAMTYWPIDLASGEFMWLYHTRENVEEANNNPGSAIQEYLIFASGHSPYFGHARFNLSKWNYSNYSSYEL
jgi:hypothetical protein